MKYRYVWSAVVLANIAPALAAPNVDIRSISRRDNIVEQSDAQWGLQRISSGKKVEGNGRFVYRYDGELDTGAGVDVYVVDTGVDTSNSEFESRASVVKNGLLDPDDIVGHGSHVAGIVGGKTYGVAKKVNILSVKIGDKRIDYLTAVEGITAAVRRHASRKSESNFIASVLNISLEFLNSSEMKGALQRAANVGMHIVVAAGNAGKDACQSYPASYNQDIKSLIVVGNLDMNDSLHSTSNYGKCVDISAPGTDITSVNGEKDTGTSFAAPMVAGVVAGQALRHKELRTDPMGMKNLILGMAAKGITNAGEKAETPDRILNMSASQ
ncbi:Suppressor of the cold-sensitive snRNP biogenesis mutant brr1-1 [Orbilia ellipsospora]|uniref:Suppressor of the cold-sensitive snRNP biogenesis mutant brr1-1 n=1 Tax=Orbilia ellipsospora TaxID=2528407 RepID=A0AAV9XQK2_9PEZI